MQQLMDSRWRPDMMANLDCSVLMWGDESQADCTSFAISLEEAVIVLSRWPEKARVYGVASRWRNSVKWSCAWAHGIPNHAPRDRPPLMKVDFDIEARLGGIRERGNCRSIRPSGTRRIVAVDCGLCRSWRARRAAWTKARRRPGNNESEMIGADRGGKGSSARPIGTHKLQYRAWRGDGIRASYGAQCVSQPQLLF